MEINLICILENKEINKEHFDSVSENSLKNEDIIYLVYRDEKIEGFLSFKMHHYLHHDRRALRSVRVKCTHTYIHLLLYTVHHLIL